MTPDDRLVGWWRDRKVRQTLEDLREFASIANDLIPRGYDEFMADRVLQVAGEAIITRIGEAANRLPEAFQKDFPEVPWRQIIDMRNRLVHHYEVTDPDQVWTALEESLPEFMQALGLTPPNDPGDSPDSAVNQGG
jgi:uncharacterized protein with HEPN domain